MQFKCLLTPFYKNCKKKIILGYNMIDQQDLKNGSKFRFAIDRGDL